MSKHYLVPGSSTSDNTPSFHSGDIVKFAESGDQLWVVIRTSPPIYCIRTLLVPDGSFATRYPTADKLELVQSGNMMLKDRPGDASKFAYAKHA